MIDNSASFLIRHGDSGYVCSVDNARAILASYSTDNRLPNDMLEASTLLLSTQENKTVVVNASNLSRVANEVLTTPVGKPLPQLTKWLHQDETVVQTLELQNAMLQWGSDNGYTLANLVKDGLHDIQYGGDCRRDTLPFVVARYGAGADLAFYEGSILEMASEYNALIKNRWKETAKVVSVVQRYLTFINEHLVHPRHDSPFELLEIKANWD